MLSLFFGAFGLSTLWLIPLFWRAIRLAIARGQRKRGGEGTIRICLGGLGVLVASATLEGVLVTAFTDDPEAGGVVCHALAGAFTGVFGSFITVVLMLVLLLASLPWYTGRSLRELFGRATVVVDLFEAALTRLGGKARPATRTQRGRGAVRRADAPVRGRQQTSKSKRETPGKATPAMGRAPVTTRASAQPGQVRRAAEHEKIIREPWLQPKHGALANSTARIVQRAPAMNAPRANTPQALTPATLPKAAALALGSTSAMPLRDVPAEAVTEVPTQPLHYGLCEDVAAPATSAQPMPAPNAEMTDASADAFIEPGSTDIEHELEPFTDPSVPDELLRPLTVHPVRRSAANDEDTPSTAAPASAPLRPRSNVQLPTVDLLARLAPSATHIDDAQLAETAELIEQRLREFKVPVTVVGASAGPVITRFEVEPAVGVRGNQIVALMKDLARGLGRTSIRVVETIPGKTCMGLELPNEQRQMIALSEILESSEYRDADSLLTLAMGKGITGEAVVADLARAPHMLVAGTTGSGKSVAVNAMILSMLYKATPDDVRMIMIDPKMLELSVYEGIPHLLAPVVTDMKLAANALAWCVAEMENRYRVMSDLRVRNLAGYNQKVREAQACGRPLLNPFPAHPEVPETLSTLPMIVVVIDELADLMMVAGKKIEELIARLAQKARAAGIHLILATQRPSVDVITGLIKANIPTRVAFQVSSKIDSRTILDQMGAESLLGQGDMLFLPPGTGYPQRIHGAFVADEEVHRVVAYLKQFGEPDYREEILAGPPGEANGDPENADAGDAELDPLYDEAAAFVLRTRRASISFVQRQFRIGYNRAARLVEAMEAAGIVSSMGINGQRDVIAPGPQD